MYKEQDTLQSIEGFLRKCRTSDAEQAVEDETFFPKFPDQVRERLLKSGLLVLDIGGNSFQDLDPAGEIFKVVPSNLKGQLNWDWRPSRMQVALDPTMMPWEGTNDHNFFEQTYVFDNYKQRVEQEFPGIIVKLGMPIDHANIATQMLKKHEIHLYNGWFVRTGVSADYTYGSRVIFGKRPESTVYTLQSVTPDRLATSLYIMPILMPDLRPSPLAPGSPDIHSRNL